MPYSKVRHGKKSRAPPAPRNSSMSAAFSRTLVTSSPIHDNKESSVRALNTFEDYELEYKRQMDLFEREHQQMLTEFDASIQNLKMSIPAELKTKTLGEMLEEAANKENANLEVSSTNDTFMKPMTIKKNNKKGNVFKQPLKTEGKRKTATSSKSKQDEASLPSSDTFVVPNKNKDVSEDEDVFKRPLGTVRNVQTSDNSFKTPNIFSATSKHTAATITPKINPNTPMCMMRRPKVGEVGVSMTGSPLLFTGIVHDELPTVTVPCRDGRIFSIMPNTGTIPEDAPAFDEKTKAYLKTLQKHLSTFCGPLNE